MFNYPSINTLFRVDINPILLYSKCILSITELWWSTFNSTFFFIVTEPPLLRCLTTNGHLHLQTWIHKCDQCFRLKLSIKTSIICQNCWTTTDWTNRLFWWKRLYQRTKGIGGVGKLKRDIDITLKWIIFSHRLILLGK